MGRSPCCLENNEVTKGPWTAVDDEKLVNCINEHGQGNWKEIPKLAGLNRCGKSCRLRWTNYLRSDIKRGKFSEEEENLIISLHSVIGNKWSKIANRLPGRTDNEIKNHWNTHLRKKLLKIGIDPVTHRPRIDIDVFSSIPHLRTNTNLSSLIDPMDITALRLQADVAQLATVQLLHNLAQVISSSAFSNIEQITYLGSSPVQNYLLNENVPLNAHSRGIVPDHYQSLQMCSNSSSQQNDQDYQLGAGFPGRPSHNQASFSNMFLSCSQSIASSSSIPFSISSSQGQESAIVNEEVSMVSTNDMSTHTSNSTTFEGWGELSFDDEDNDYFCKKFIT